MKSTPHNPRLARNLPRDLLGLALLFVPACGTHLDHALITARTNRLYGDSPPVLPATPFPAQTGPELLEGADLDAYISYGLYHNQAIRMAFERWRGALARVTQATELPDPRFSWAYFAEPIETRTGPQNNRLSLSQTFPWFGKLDQQGEVAAREAEAMWWKVQAQRLQVVREIKHAYFDYAFLARHIRITGDNLELLRQLEPVIQRNIQVGGSQIDLLQLQVEIGRLENTSQSLGNYRLALSARLSAALNRPDRDPLPWPELSEPDVVEIDTEAVARSLGRDNPELGELRERIRREESREELAHLEGWPDLTLGVDYFDTGQALLPSTPGSGDDPWALTLSVNLPIFRGKYDALIEEAHRASSAATAALDERDNELRAQLQMVFYNLDNSVREIALHSETLLPRARQSLALTDSAYRAGDASLLDWMDRQRSLLTFEQGYWRACASYGKSLADLETITGEEIR